ncbi:hypothetical protein, partial [Escherichia coli]|uniref:hypothetical protein n=1 Tax=Escherichia coli TaxID=562 RepID=UPI001BAF3146
VNKRCNKSAKKCCACLFVTHEYYFNFKNIEQSALLKLLFDLITEVRYMNSLDILVSFRGGKFGAVVCVLVGVQSGWSCVLDLEVVDRY